MRPTLPPAPIVGIALLSLAILAPRAAAQRVAETGKPVPAGPAPTSYFGSSVSVSGNRLLVGAMFDGSPVVGAGAAFVYDRQPDGTWLQAAKLQANDAALGDGLGRSVSLVGDTAMLGASDDDATFSGQGSVYVFERQQNGAWLQAAHLFAADAAADDSFGWSVALSPSGLRAAVGAPNDDDNIGGLNRGSVYLFERVGGVWTVVSKIWAPDAATQDSFGFCVALRDDRVFVGAHQADPQGNSSGAVYVFSFGAGGTAGYQQKIVPTTGGGANQQFGMSLDVSGSRLVIGAPIATGAFSFQGAAYFFSENGAGVWSQDSKVFASDAHANDSFGRAVSIEGDSAVIGAPHVMGPNGEANHGQAYLFLRQPNGTWLEADKFVSPEAVSSANFGAAIAIDGTRILVGAYAQSFNKGAAWTFRDCGANQYAFGTGTPGCSGTQGLSAFAAEIGSVVFAFRGDNGPTANLGLGIIGDAANPAGSDPFAIGVKLHVDLLASATIVSFDAVTDAGGFSFTPLAIPNNPLLVGSEFYAQEIWAWTSECSPTPGPFGLSSSRGVAFPMLQ